MQKIIRLPEVIKTTGLSRSTIYHRIKEKSFPMQISLGKNAVGWLATDIDHWIKDLITASRNS